MTVDERANDLFRRLERIWLESAEVDKQTIASALRAAIEEDRQIRGLPFAATAVFVLGLLIGGGFVAWLLPLFD